MKSLPIVALIGQTNAGKSSLLNRFARKNIAIVAREEGTTRDNVSARIDDRFLLVDTAGLKDPDDDFEASIQDQIADAIDSAALILLTLDATKYPDQRDKDIAKKALRSKKPVFLLLNKSDRGDALPASEFLRLGIKPAQTFAVSATTGQGIKELKTAILHDVGMESRQRAQVALDAGDGHNSFSEASATNRELEQASSDGAFSSEKLSQATAENAGRATPATAGWRDGRFEVTKSDVGQSVLKLALIGRPNVGKSSLFNALGKKQQAIVSSRQIGRASCRERV